MSQHGLVSESVVSELSLELVSYTLRGNSQKKEINFCRNKEVDTEFGSKGIEGLGLLVGLRSAERLLYREATFGGSTPNDVARFVGQHLWKTVFGKKVDRMKHMDKIYFCLIDNNFRWLQGFSDAKSDQIVSAVDGYPYDSSEKYCGGDGPTDQGKESGSVLPPDSDVLRYAVSILRGFVQVMYPSGPIKIQASRNEKGETQFVLDFRSVAT